MKARVVVPRQLQIAAVLLIAVVFGGTAGFVTLEHWSWFDAFYMTVTTITTVGGGGGGGAGGFWPAGRWGRAPPFRGTPPTDAGGGGGGAASARRGGEVVDD